MRLFYCGDVVGRTGRDLVIKMLPTLREKMKLDFVVVNAENSAHGFGATPDICKQIYDAGADVIVMGNHVWDQREIIPFMDKEKRILRALNFPKTTAGSGYGIYETVKGKKVLVFQVMGRQFMEPLDCPFVATDELLRSFRLKANVDVIIADMHGEATSEKMAFGHFCDGRVSMVVGSHTHVPTADLQILSGGTAYLTDAGMSGSYDSVIGMRKEESVSRFVTRVRREKFVPASGEASLCGMFVETDDATGLCKDCRTIRLEGSLKELTTLDSF